MSADERGWRLEPFHVVALGAVKISFQRARQGAGGGAPRSFGALPMALDVRTDRTGDIVVPTGDAEAVWLGFVAETDASRHAVRIRIVEGDRCDALTGKAWRGPLMDRPQNYAVVPPQTAIYGVQQTEDCARQFARTPQGGGAAACRRIEIVVIGGNESVQQTARKTPTSRGPLDALGPPALRGGSPECADGVPQIIERDSGGVGMWSGPACTFAVTLLAPDEFSALTGSAPLAPLDEDRTYRGWRLP